AFVGDAVDQVLVAAVVVGVQGPVEGAFDQGDGASAGANAFLPDGQGGEASFGGFGQLTHAQRRTGGGAGHVGGGDDGVFTADLLGSAGVGGASPGPVGVEVAGGGQAYGGGCGAYAGACGGRHWLGGGLVGFGVAWFVLVLGVGAVVLVGGFGGGLTGRAWFGFAWFALVLGVGAVVLVGGFGGGLVGGWFTAHGCCCLGELGVQLGAGLFLFGLDRLECCDDAGEHAHVGGVAGVVVAACVELVEAVAADLNLVGQVDFTGGVGVDLVADVLLERVGGGVGVGGAEQFDEGIDDGGHVVPRVGGDSWVHVSGP